MRLNGNLVPDVLSSIKLFRFSCTCTYVPNSTLQCLSYVFFCPVNIVLGPIVACTPSLCGKLFSQNTQLYTISTISHRGYLSTVRVVAIFYLTYQTQTGKEITDILKDINGQLFYFCELVSDIIVCGIKATSIPTNHHLIP